MRREHFFKTNMASTEGNNSIVVLEAILEDQIADLWPGYPCLYDVKSSDFKNRDMRDQAVEEMANKLGQSGK